MNVAFLTPLGAVLGALALAPLVVFVLRQRRARRIRAALGLEPSGAAARLTLLLALAGVPVLLGLAAAQPVLESDRQRVERTDAEVWVVLDTSRSMLASARAGSPTRFARARELTLRLAEGLPEVPLGLTSMTDRILPHVFPTTDTRVVAEALSESMGIERPGPTVSLSSVPTTTLDSLAAIPRLNYFSPTARKRLLVVLTDAETRPLEQDLSGPYAREPRIATLLVRVGEPGEEVYTAGVAEDAYEPPGGADAALERIASQVEGRVLAADELVAAAGEALGIGPTRQRIIEGERRALMPWVALAAFLPLGVVLLRRNL
ncbi:MAG: VWA domain-containing protein [Thermoleophilia bacterium]|nr:VWA domain-containing protein [Thermoleophilia bacterium]